MNIIPVHTYYFDIILIRPGILLLIRPGSGILLGLQSRTSNFTISRKAHTNTQPTQPLQIMPSIWRTDGGTRPTSQLEPMVTRTVSLSQAVRFSGSLKRVLSRRMMFSAPLSKCQIVAQVIASATDAHAPTRPDPSRVAIAQLGMSRSERRAAEVCVCVPSCRWIDVWGVFV